MLAAPQPDQTEAATHTEAVGDKISERSGRSIACECRSPHLVQHWGDAVPGHLASVEDLLKRQTWPCTQARMRGVMRCASSIPDVEIAVTKRRAEDDLRYAIQARQFLLHYQPQLAGWSGGFRNLVRWKHPARMVSPSNSSAGGGTAPILPLGRWVITAACVNFALWATRPEMAHHDRETTSAPTRFRRRLCRPDAGDSGEHWPPHRLEDRELRKAPWYPTWTRSSRR